MPILQTILGKLRPKDKQARPLLIEVAPSARMELLAASFTNEATNLDEILRYKSNGKGYTFYHDMLAKDPHLKAKVEERARGVASKEYEIVPFDPEIPACVEQAEFAMKVLDNVLNFTGIEEQMLYAPYLGFSVGEILWQIDAAGFVTIADIRARHNNRLAFSPEGELLLKKDATSFIKSPVPPNKFIVVRHNSIGENFYGLPEARCVFFYWWGKIECMKDWFIASEKYGTPTIDAAIDGNIPPDKEATLSDDLDNLAYAKKVIHSKAVTLSLLEAVKRGDLPFESLISRCNQEISIGIVGQTLTTTQGNTGTQALGTVHEGIRQDIIQADAEMEAAAINEQLIVPLIDFNFAPESIFGYPRFIKKYEPPEDLKLAMEILTGLVAVGLKIKSDDVYEQFAYVKPETGDDVLEKAEPVLLGGNVESMPNKMPDDMPKPVKEAASLEGQSIFLSDPFKFYSEPIHLAAEDPTSYLPGLPPINSDPNMPKPIYPAGFDRNFKEVKRYQIGSILSIQDKFRTRLRQIYGSLTNSYINRFAQDPERALDFLDDLIKAEFGDRLNRPLTDAVKDTIRYSARDMARQLEMKFNRGVLESYTKEYLASRAYERGTIADIAETMRELMASKIDTVIQSGGDLSEMTAALRDTFADLSTQKINQIAVTETRAAANWAVLESGKNSKLKLEAWFVVDPASCIICQTWASKNPYSLAKAQNMLIPHPQCNDYWTMTVKQ